MIYYKSRDIRFSQPRINYLNCDLQAHPIMDEEEEYFAREMRQILHSKSSDAVSQLCKLPSCEPSRLMDHIYIGSQSNAENLRILRNLGITHVLNCAGYKGPKPFPNASPYEGLGIEYHEFEAEDSDSYDIVQIFPEAFRFLDEVKQTGGVALVHCNLGINRSSAVCVGYMMSRGGKTLLEATKAIKKKRNVVLTNKYFQRQLIRFAQQNGHLVTTEVKKSTGKQPTNLVVELRQEAGGSTGEITCNSTTVCGVDSQTCSATSIGNRTDTAPDEQPTPSIATHAQEGSTSLISNRIQNCCQSLREIRKCWSRRLIEGFQKSRDVTQPEFKRTSQSTSRLPLTRS